MGGLTNAQAAPSAYPGSRNTAASSLLSRLFVLETELAHCRIFGGHGLRATGHAVASRVA